MLLTVVLCYKTMVYIILILCHIVPKSIGGKSVGDITIKTIEIEKPEDMNFILGQTHFIKSVEDLYEVMVSTVPQAKFGIAFCEASGLCKVRSEGNDQTLQKLAEKNALAIGAGHSFIIFMNECFPINVLNAIKMVPEVCSIYCATANPTKVVVAEGSFGKEKGRGIIGVIDGYMPKGIENKEDISWRKTFLRNIGYKR